MLDLHKFIFPREYPTHGDGFGKLYERDFLKKREKEILRARQHNKCFLCKRQMLTTQKIEVCHIIAKTKGGQLYDKSPNFPDAEYPNACLGHKHCNLKMGWELGIWQSQVAEYYGFKLTSINHNRCLEKARQAWIKSNARPKLYPFWLIKETGEPIFLTDGFDEQAYFRSMTLTYEPFVEEDGSLIPIGLGKSRF